MKTPRNPDTIHPPLAAYSHQIEITGPERLLVIAGQVGIAPDGDIPDDPIEQLGLAIDNVERNLEAAGMDFGDLVRLTTYLVGEWDSQARTLTLSVRGPGGESTMVLAWLSADEWRALLERAGFEVEALHGWFDRRPFKGGEDMVWIARRIEP